MQRRRSVDGGLLGPKQDFLKRLLRRVGFTRGLAALLDWPGFIGRFGTLQRTKASCT